MKNEFVVIDFETTGLRPLKAEIVEVAALKIVGGKVIEEFEMLVKPRVPVEKGAFAVHGLSDAHLSANGKPPLEVWTKLHMFIMDLPLIAHNGLNFDFQFIFNALSEFKLGPAANPLLDSYTLAPLYLQPRLGKFNLPDLCASYSVQNSKAHRAMGDARALAEILAYIFKEQAELSVLWEDCGGFTLPALGELPSGFAEIQRAIAEGLEVQIDYQGKDKPRSSRWIRPLHVRMSGGKRYIVSMCLQDLVEKSFLCSGVIGVLQTRPVG